MKKKIIVPKKVQILRRNLRKDIKNIIKTKRLSYDQLSRMSEVAKTTMFRFITSPICIPRARNLAKMIKFTSIFIK